jgi:hypothetical protein
VSSRDRICRRRLMPREGIASTSPPAFLFPIQRCQRPKPPKRPHRLAPGVGGGGYLVAPVFRVNRLFEAFIPARTEAREETKAGHGFRRRTLEKSMTESIGGRVLTDRTLEKQEKSSSRHRWSAAASPARGGIYPPSLLLSTPVPTSLSKSSKRRSRPKSGPRRTGFTPSVRRPKPAEGGLWPGVRVGASD